MQPQPAIRWPYRLPRGLQLRVLTDGERAGDMSQVGVMVYACIMFTDMYRDEDWIPLFSVRTNRGGRVLVAEISAREGEAQDGEDEGVDWDVKPVMNVATT